MIARGHLALVVSQGQPTDTPVLSRRLDLDIIEAARRWADEMHAMGASPGSSPLGAATRRLLDAIHDLDHHETTGRFPSPGPFAVDVE